MKERMNRFLSRNVNMENTVTACMATFLATIILMIVWLTVLAGGFGNLIHTVKFAQVLSVIERIYIGEADTDEIADMAFSTMLAQLEDRWSYYMSKEDYEQYKQAQSNQYTGIGITLQKAEKGWRIVAVADGSPAAKAGIAVDTYLVVVNDVDVSEMESTDISAFMRETPDDISVVTVDDEGNRNTYKVSIEVVYTNPVSFEMKDGNIGYIKIENFDETCAEKGKEAVDRLIEDGASALIFDVRNNGGGYVTEMCDLLDHLLPEGPIFISVDHDGKEKMTESDSNYVDLPMAVLVNENSYSAAEFFAAALREYEAATVVGTQTTGKNRSQTNMLLVDGSAIHISSKNYLTPNRVDLTEQGGITPDIVVEFDENDAQMSAALELFN